MSSEENDRINYLRILGSIPIPSELEREDKATEIIRASLEKQINDACERAILGCTSTTAAAPPPLDLKSLTRQWSNWSARIKRESVTFVVIAGHPDDMILATAGTSTEGNRYEMSPATAKALHREWPIKLSKIISEDMAEFVPVLGVFNEIFPLTLPMPPFDVPDEDQG